MVQAQTESTAQQQAQPRRRASSSTKQRVVATIAVLLMASGAILLVTAFVLALSDRNSGPNQTLSSALAERIEKAGLGCAEFKGNSPTAGVLNEGQCAVDTGVLRILVYRSTEEAVNRQKFTQNYQCLVRASAGETQIVSISDGFWVIKPPTADMAVARDIRKAVGGRITTVDCAPQPAPPSSAPPPAPEPGTEPAPEAPPA